MENYEKIARQLKRKSTEVRNLKKKLNFMNKLYGKRCTGSTVELFFVNEEEAQNFMVL